MNGIERHADGRGINRQALQQATARLIDAKNIGRRLLGLPLYDFDKTRYVSARKRFATLFAAPAAGAAA